MISNTAKKIIRGMFSLSVSALVRLVSGFLVTAIGARYVLEEDFGVYYLLYGLIFLLEVFGNMGLSLSAAKFVSGASHKKDYQSNIVNNLFTIRMIASVGISVIAWVGKDILLYLFPSELLRSLFYFVPILFTVRLMENIFKYIMQGYQLYRKMAIVEIIIGVSYLVFTVVFLVIFKMAVVGLILGMGVSLFLGLIIRIIYIPTRIRFAFDKEIMGQVVRFGVPLQINDMFNYAIERVNTLILGAMLNPAYVAFLEIAMRIPESLRSITDVFHSVYFPHLSELYSEEGENEATDMLHHLLRIFSFFSLFASLFFILYSNEIISLAFTDTYLLSAPALGIFMIIYAITLFSAVLDASFIAKGHSAYILVVNATVAAVNVIGNLLLIPSMNFLGSAISRLIAEMVGNPLSLFSARFNKIMINPMMYLKSVFIFLTCMGGYFLFHFENIYARAIFLVIYGVLGIAFSVVTFEDLRYLVSSIMPVFRRFLPSHEK
ncbi:MAG: oligosaccharide flippase family protein [Anaerolineales bacterium]|nr:oligosaccharide flippase family protein [Anaerolineales bacterium]